MPALERCDRTTDAILWPIAGFDGRGQPVIGKPIQLDARAGTGVRWNDKRRERRQPNGSTIITDVQVIADREVPIGSLIVKGRIEDYRTLVDTQPPVAPVYQVASSNATPNIKGRTSWVELGLMKYKGSLPNVP